MLEESLNDEFNNFVTVIVTDRGSEFVLADEMEKLGVKVFFIDCNCSMIFYPQQIFIMCRIDII